jgi:hypothetical protein
VFIPDICFTAGGMVLIPGRRVTEDSVLAVQIFDQKKFKKKDQGFLGVINVRIGSVIDLDAGGDGTTCLHWRRDIH